MNSHFCFMIRFIMKNYDGIEQELFDVLSENILNYYKDSTITLKHSEGYWKYPEEQEVIYGITLTSCIDVKEFIAHFPISWLYKESNVYDVDLKKSCVNECAIWSKNCHPEEIFLLPKVSWVHIYTWSH